MQERASRTRALILRAAAEMFEARGYSGARLDDIVARRNVSKGALYFHFSSKEALATAVVEEYRAVWAALVDELSAECPRAMQRLFVLSMRLAHRFRDDPLLRAGVRLTIERNLVSPSVHSLFRGLAHDFEQLLQLARAQGDLVAGVEIPVVARFLVAAVVGCQQTFVAVGDQADLPECLSMMWTTLLPGLVREDRLAELREFLAADAVRLAGAAGSGAPG